MKTNAYVGKFSYGFRLASMILLTAFLSISAFSANKSDGTTRFEGVITDSKSKEALAFTNVIVAGTNIATVCNSDGEFTLKVPNEHLDKNVMFSHIGYQTATVPLRELKTNEINKITLNMTSVSLVEVNVFPSDPERIVREMIRQRDANYSDFSNTKTAFYRETIKKGRNYVSLTEASYIVDYRITDGKWHYGYARASVAFRVNWKKKLLNTNYYTTMEMAVTDWKIAEDQAFKASERLKPTIIMEDAVEGFNDPDFWGDYNVIEPEQPIENAIKRIQRNLDK